MRVRYTKAAQADLAEIHRYMVKREGAQRAREVIERIRQMLVILETQPEAGSVPDLLADLGISDFRQVVSGPYLVMYSNIGDVVYVLLVADGRRDYRGLLKARLLGRG